jgi:hypothetical protein
MAGKSTPASITAALTVPEQPLLFCLASDTRPRSDRDPPMALLRSDRPRRAALRADQTGMRHAGGTA